MEAQALIVSAIVLDRMAIVIAAFFCVYFGWNLFCRAIYVGQNGIISVGEWKELAMDAAKARTLTSLFFQAQFLWILNHEVGHHLLNHVPPRPTTRPSGPASRTGKPTDLPRGSS